MTKRLSLSKYTFKRNEMQSTDFKEMGIPTTAMSVGSLLGLLVPHPPRLRGSEATEHPHFLPSVPSPRAEAETGLLGLGWSLAWPGS